MLRTKQWKGASVALATASVMVLAGCGGSSDGSGGTSGAGESTIKIGVTAALSGHSSSLWSEAAKIPKVWADSVNAAGGINGHKVEVIVKDTKSDPAAGAAAAQDLVQNEKVAAVMSLDTVAEVSVAAFLQTAKVPLLGVTFTPAISEKPLVFNVTTGPGSFIPGIVQGAKLDGHTKFGLFYCSEAPSCAATNAIYGKVAPSLGMTFTGKLSVDSDAPNYTAACLTLIKKDTDFIELDTSATGAVRMAKDCLAQGFKGAFGGVASAANPGLFKQVKGGTFIASLNAFPWWVDAKPVVAYRDAIKKYDSSVKYQASAPAAAWTQLELLKKAMENSDDVSAAGVAKAMGTIKDETLGGLLPSPVTLDPSKPTTSATCYWLMKYTADDDKLSLLTSGESGNGATDSLASTCLKS